MNEAALYAARGNKRVVSMAEFDAAKAKFSQGSLFFVTKQYSFGNDSVILGKLLRMKGQLGVWITTSLLPLGLFFLLAPMARIGLHWLAAFIPGLLILSYYLPIKILHRLVVMSVLFSALHFLAVMMYSSIEQRIDILQSRIEAYQEEIKVLQAAKTEDIGIFHIHFQ